MPYAMAAVIAIDIITIMPAFSEVGKSNIQITPAATAKTTHSRSLTSRFLMSKYDELANMAIITDTLTSSKSTSSLYTQCAQVIIGFIYSSGSKPGKHICPQKEP